MAKVVTSIKNCARCGKDHTDLEFNEFTVPIPDTDGTLWTHWALCPTNKEPVLLKVKNNG